MFKSKGCANDVGLQDVESLSVRTGKGEHNPSLPAGVAPSRRCRTRSTTRSGSDSVVFKVFQERLRPSGAPCCEAAEKGVERWIFVARSC